MMQFLSLIEGGTWPGLGFKKINFFQRLFFMMRDVADVVVVVVVVFEVTPPCTSFSRCCIYVPEMLKRCEKRERSFGEQNVSFKMCLLI